MKTTLQPLVFLILCAVLSLPLSNAGQETETQSVIKRQWDNSLHAGSMDTLEEKERMNQPGCAHCHTAQGYWREILAGKKSKAPYEKATGITCEACHDPEKMSPDDPALRAGSPEKACTGCHDILVQNDDKGFSSCLQGTILRGEGGAEFEGTAYRTATHSQVENNCVGCHMAESPEGDQEFLLGGHVFRVITKGHEPRLFNDTGCMECHVTITLAGIDKSQTEVKELMQAIKDLLPKQKDGEPKFPEDPLLNKIQAKAAFNYHYILKDGTWGIHNPIYIRQLLQSSLEALETEALRSDQKTSPGKTEIKLALVGQSLIKADPRKHWSYPFGSVRKIVESSDVGFTNFEMAVDNNCGVPDNYQVLTGRPALENNRPGNTSGPHAVQENIMGFLSSMNFKLQSLANNHAWDLGDCGILATIAAAKKYGVIHAGTGNNLQEATQAAIMEVKGVKIALVAATTAGDERGLILPSDSSPGVNGVWTGWQEDWDRNISAVRAASQSADFVIYYHHFQIDQNDADGKGRHGHNNVGDMHKWQEVYAKATIDAGAGLYIAHGDRIFDGVEIYKGRPIFRQFGGFSYQGLQDEGAYDPLVWQGLLGMLTIKDGYICSIEIFPLELDEGSEREYGDAIEFREKRGFSEVAEGPMSIKILTRFKDLSTKYGTIVKIEEGKAIIDIGVGDSPQDLLK